MKSNKVIFAAGGSGGHIIPAIAIAEAMKELNSNLQFHFVGTRRGLEKKIIPSKGYPLSFLRVGQLNSNVSKLTRLRTLLLLPLALFQSLYLLIRHRPMAVVGVGGYASGPLLLVASWLKYKTFLWEPNAFPGMANRKLAPYVTKGYVQFEESLKKLQLKKYMICGYPLRKQFEGFIERTPLDSRPINILIFGGSQGSKAMNEAMSEIYSSFQDRIANFKFVHQLGRTDFHRFRSTQGATLERLSSQVEVYEFIEDIQKYYRWADIAVCRSGMGTIAELAASSLPGVFIPLPSAADNHQQKNAEQMVAFGAGKMLLQKDLTGERLLVTLEEMIKNIDEMSMNIHKFHKPNSAKSIAEDIIKESQ